jgi:predicted MFS family arabinose efflux permease
MRKAAEEQTLQQEHVTTAHPGIIALSGLIALAIAMGIGRFAFTPLLPMMQEDAGLSVAAGGWLASANYAGYLVGALSAMHLTFDRGAAIRAALCAIVLSTLAMGVTDGVIVWAALRAAAGLASAWALISVSAWSSERLASLQRPLLSAAVFSGVGAGIALAGLVCVALMHFQVASSPAWITLGTLALMLTAIIWPVFSDESGSSARSRAAAPGRLRWSRDRVRMVVCYGAFGFGYIIPATFLPAMAKQIISDPAVFGWSWPLFGAAAFAATLAISVLQSRFSNRSLWIGAELVMALGVALPALSPGIVAIMLAALLVGGTLVVITMVGVQEAQAVGGPDAPRLVAAMTAAFAFGQTAGPVAVSTLAHFQSGISIALLSASALLVMSAAALYDNSAREAQGAKRVSNR